MVCMNHLTNNKKQYGVIYKYLLRSGGIHQFSWNKMKYEFVLINIMTTLRYIAIVFMYYCPSRST